MMAEKMQPAYGDIPKYDQQGPGSNYMYSPVSSAPQVSQGGISSQFSNTNPRDAIDSGNITSLQSPMHVTGAMPTSEPPPPLPGFQPSVNLPVEKMDVIPGYDSAIRGVCLFFE